MKLAIDLFCGLGGWTEGLLAEGWRVIGVDIERHEYGEHRYPADLMLRDVRTIHGSLFRDAGLIVASPPCQFFSYTAMPWKRAKRLAAEVRSDPKLLAEKLELFNSCFRIQREASEAAGRRIPMVVENVRGAQPWVGKARASFGSFYLWGDAPALMPPIAKAGGLKSDGGSWFGDYAAMKEGVKQRGSGREWLAGDGKISRMTSSKSPARKFANAMIAKIPPSLARHIARVYSYTKVEDCPDAAGLAFAALQEDGQ